MSVPDRDSGRPCEVTVWRVVQGVQTRRDLHRWAARWARQLWTHEFDEGLTIDGRRVTETHTAENTRAIVRYQGDTE